MSAPTPPPRPPHLPSIEQQQFAALEQILDLLQQTLPPISQGIGDLQISQFIPILQQIRDNQIAQTVILSALRDLVAELAADLAPSPTTTSIAIAFGNAGDSMPATPGTQAVGSTLSAKVVPLEADGVTITPGATLTTNPTWSVDNTAIATIVSNADGTATITGVSTGTVTVTASGAVFTDSDGTATSPLTATNQDTVTQPTGRTTSMQIVFA